MKRKDRKNKIKSLKKTNPAFSKGAVWTKLAVVLCLLMLVAMQAYIYWYMGGISEIALVHLAIQSLAVLMILRGGKLMIWVYGLAMLASLGMAYWLNLQAESLFYQAQMLYFLASFLVMMFLICNTSARTYRKELAALRKKKPKEESIAEEVKPETAEKLADNQKTEEAVSEQNEEKTIESEVLEKTEGTVKIVQNEMLQVSCPPNVQLNYGSFSRFLVQHYPFVYLHPKFDLETSPWVQMCIVSEGFDKESEDLYSGEFLVHQSVTEQGKMIWLEYTDEMSRLCALICADWLVMQKGTFLKDGVNISQQLMKQLTEAFVLAKDAEKKPFEGFKNRDK